MADYLSQGAFQPSLPRHLLADEDRRLIEAFGISIEPDGEDKLVLFADDWCTSGVIAADDPKDDLELAEDDLYSCLQGIIRRANGELTWISRETAYTCTRNRPDGFGGSAVFITANEVQIIGTSSWLEQRIHEAETGTNNPVTDGSCCPDCTVPLELSRTDTLFGIDREIYLCPECDESYLKKLAAADSPIERAVKCVGCDHLIGRSSAHIFYQSDDLAHFIGDCCWDERLRD